MSPNPEESACPEAKRRLEKSRGNPSPKECPCRERLESKKECVSWSQLRLPKELTRHPSPFREGARDSMGSPDSLAEARGRRVQSPRLGTGRITRSEPEGANRGNNAEVFVFLCFQFFGGFGKNERMTEVENNAMVQPGGRSEEIRIVEKQEEEEATLWSVQKGEPRR